MLRGRGSRFVVLEFVSDGWMGGFNGREIWGLTSYLTSDGGMKRGQEILRCILILPFS